MERHSLRSSVHLQVRELLLYLILVWNGTLGNRATKGIECNLHSWTLNPIEQNSLLSIFYEGWLIVVCTIKYPDVSIKTRCFIQAKRSLDGTKEPNLIAVNLSEKPMEVRFSRGVHDCLWHGTVSYSMLWRRGREELKRRRLRRHWYRHIRLRLGTSYHWRCCFPECGAVSRHTIVHGGSDPPLLHFESGILVG